MLGREFLNVAVQVLRGQLVERAFVRPLERGPEALHPVRVRHVVNVLGDTVPD